MTLKFRKDIAGLRGIAILLVLSNHLVARNFRNGYVGVDLFFVLSGYLIIGGMFRTYEESVGKHGRNADYSIWSFYLRRFLRLAPAALVVTFTTLALSFIFFNSVRATIVIRDAIWSSIFLANYHFMQTGVDYFSRQSLPSPFQHFWSLSIEEQFYILFPGAFIFLLSMHGFRVGKLLVGWRNRVVIFLSMGFVISFIYAIVLFHSQPNHFYFSTPARVWELLLGGLTYVLETRIILSQSKRSVIIRSFTMSALFGYVVLGGGTAVVSFPVIVAATLFGSLAIICYSDPKFPGRILLENRFLIFVGSISYSLYLWHWPIIIFAQNWIRSEYLVNIVFISLSFLAAFFSRRYIELPVIALNPRKDLKISEVPFFRFIPNINIWDFKIKSWIALLVIFSMPGIALFNTANPAPTTIFRDVSGDSNRNSSILNSSETSTQLNPNSSEQYQQLLSYWSGSISESLKIKKVPSTLDPPFSKILDERGIAWTKCLFIYKNSTCVFGKSGSTRKVVVLGDSFAASLMPAIVSAFEGSNVEIIGLTLHECGVSDVTPWLLGSAFLDCKVNRDWAIQRIIAINPELLIMAENSFVPIEKSGSLATDRERDNIWAVGLKSTFSKISALRGKKVFIGQWPVRERSITDCVDAQMNISDSCVGRTQNGAKQRQIASNLATAAGIAFADPTRWLCDAYLCPALIQNSPVTFDNAHLGATFSRKLGPILKSFLASIGVIF